MRRQQWLPAVLVLLVLGGYWYLRGERRTPIPPVRPPALPAVSAPGPEAPRSPMPAPPAAIDPLIRRWHAAILTQNQREVLESQDAFRAREDEYRGPLMKLAAEDPEPRVRAFTVSLLGRFRSPPPESFFIDRLSDASEHPRESALAALERIGTTACLASVDRLASSDASERVRASAARAARAVRAR